MKSNMNGYLQMMDGNSHSLLTATVGGGTMGTVGVKGLKGAGTNTGNRNGDRIVSSVGSMEMNYNEPNLPFQSPLIVTLPILSTPLTVTLPILSSLYHFPSPFPSPLPSPLPSFLPLTRKSDKSEHSLRLISYEGMTRHQKQGILQHINGGLFTINGINSFHSAQFKYLEHEIDREGEVIYAAIDGRVSLLDEWLQGRLWNSNTQINTNTNTNNNNSNNNTIIPENIFWQLTTNLCLNLHQLYSKNYQIDNTQILTMNNILICEKSRNNLKGTNNNSYNNNNINSNISSNNKNNQNNETKHWLTAIQNSPNRLKENNDCIGVTHATPSYLLPPPPSSIWQLGCILYQLIALTAPPSPPTRPQPLPRSLSKQIERIVLWCLQPKAQNRPTLVELTGQPQIGVRIKGIRLEGGWNDYYRKEGEIRKREAEVEGMMGSVRLMKERMAGSGSGGGKGENSNSSKNASHHSDNASHQKNLKGTNDTNLVNPNRSHTNSIVKIQPPIGKQNYTFNTNIINSNEPINHNNQKQHQSSVDRYNNMTNGQNKSARKTNHRNINLNNNINGNINNNIINNSNNNNNILGGQIQTVKYDNGSKTTKIQMIPNNIMKDDRTKVNNNKQISSHIQQRSSGNIKYVKEGYLVGRQTNGVGRQMNGVGRQMNVNGRQTNVISKQSNVIIKQTNPIVRQSNPIVRQPNLVTKQSTIINRIKSNSIGNISNGNIPYGRPQIQPNSNIGTVASHTTSHRSLIRQQPSAQTALQRRLNEMHYETNINKSYSMIISNKLHGYHMR